MKGYPVDTETKVYALFALGLLTAITVVLFRSFGVLSDIRLMLDAQATRDEADRREQSKRLFDSWAKPAPTPLTIRQEPIKAVLILPHPPGPVGLSSPNNALLTLGLNQRPKHWPLFGDTSRIGFPVCVIAKPKRSDQ